MSKDEQLAFIMRVLVASEDDMCDTIFWRTDGEYAPITFLVNCNDLFHWACSDAEEITPGNVGEMEEAISDAKAAEPERYQIYAMDLFCCRARKMRPQQPAYPVYHFGELKGQRIEALAKLLDACGPERSRNDEG